MLRLTRLLLASALAALACIAQPSGGAPPASNATPDGIIHLAIHDIQGAGHISPLVGVTVLDVPGLVTATRRNGFYLQDPKPDTDERTSEGIFVFTATGPTVAIGDGVTVSGAVSEFRPGCPPASCTRDNSAFANLTVTEIVASSVQLTSSGNPLPPPVVVGMGSRLPPTAVVAGSGDVEDSGFFDPAVNGIDFF